jgi:hypothetical protein
MTPKALLKGHPERHDRKAPPTERPVSSAPIPVTVRSSLAQTGSLRVCVVLLLAEGNRGAFTSVGTGQVGFPALPKGAGL